MNEITLEKRIYNDYVAALKNKEKEKAQFLNFIRAGIKNIAINEKKELLSDEEVFAVLNKTKKQLIETKESGITANKPDIVAKADKELDIIKAYLPKPLDESDLIEIIDKAINETGAASPKDMGKVMKEVMAKVGIRADAKKISSLVKEKLSSD
jgi:uncharacterized protein YqeY